MVVKKEIKERVLKKVDEISNDTAKLLQEMVRIPSVTGDELEAQKFMEKVFRDRVGLKTKLVEADMNVISKHPDFFKGTSFMKRGGVDYKDRPNVIGTLKGAGGGKSILLDGHIDVVSPEPVSRWKHNPWAGEIVDGKLYGRGAFDMKCGIAAMTMAVKCLQDLGIKPKGDVIVESSVDEEDGGVGGPFATILQGYTADACIDTEPSGPNDIGVGCVGTAYFRVKIPGITAHAGVAHTGVNAIGKAMKVYQALADLNEYRQKMIHNPLFEAKPENVGRATTLNVGKIQGGDWPSTVAGWCNVECRIGFPPNTSDTMESVQAQIRETLDHVSKLDPFLRDREPLELEWFGWKARPSQQDTNHPFPQLVKATAEDVTKKPANFNAFPGSNDDRHYRIYGKMPCVIYGPGGMYAHGIDEYCDVSTFAPVTKVIALTILDWCGYEE
jgi:acetylornithine deacetylase